MSMTSPRLSFKVEHYDTLAQMIKKYQLFYYPEDCSIEQYTVVNTKLLPMPTNLPKKLWKNCVLLHLP